ncbi:hypothetical protein [Roseibium sp.]|uniref:hypothetical protein n=1 Tax=Roseibium sp. TaxID=1936156 RepID=UPI003D09D05B
MIGIVKFLLRVSGFGLLAIAILVGIADASRSIAESEVMLKPLGQLWFEMSPETLNLSQAVIQRYVHPAVWDPMLQTVLTWPAWAVFAGVGVLFLLLGGRRQKRRFRYA